MKKSKIQKHQLAKKQEKSRKALSYTGPLSNKNLPHEVQQKLLELSETLEYSDNFRVCKVGDEESKKEYDKKLSNGCCGFYDEKIKLPDGSVWLIGCNYGH